MTLVEKLHKVAIGWWWYAPLTLVAYWSFAALCLWTSISAAREGRFDQLWRGIRLFAGGERSITFADRPIAFMALILLFAAVSLGLFLIGWIKFSRRRLAYIANAKYI